MTVRGTFLVYGLAAFAMCAPSAARADDPSAGSIADGAAITNVNGDGAGIGANGVGSSNAKGTHLACEAHLRRGVELRHLGRNAEALAEFQEAITLEPSPRARAQVAMALEALGSWQEAERALVEALEAPEDLWIARYRSVLESALADVRGHLGWLSVEANATEGELLVGGRLVRRLPVVEPVRVLAGNIEVEVRAPGRAPVRQTVAVPQNGTARAGFVLEVLPQAPAQPLRADQVVAPIEMPPDPPNHSAGSRLGAYVAFGASALFAGGGVGASVVQQDNAAIYDDDKKCLALATTRQEQCSSYGDTARVALGIELGAFAIAALSAGVGVWLLTKPSHAQTAVAGSWCALGARSISCGGEF